MHMTLFINNDMCIESMPCIIGKLSMKATTFLSISFQLEVCTRSYKHPKWLNSQLGSPMKNVIWMYPLWHVTKNSIRGKVLVSPKFRSWWVLWICVCSCLICALKMFQLCTNQLVIWFIQINMNNQHIYLSS
jgi:hypothetical protein